MPKVYFNTAQQDANVVHDAPIAIGMDYNANINWIVAGQPVGNRLNIIKSFTPSSSAKSLHS